MRWRWPRDTFKGEIMSNEFFDGMPNSDYHATNDISKSTLDMASGDPFGPMWARRCPQDKDRLKTFDFGDAMHAICLEPERIDSEFITIPPFNLRTNSGKEDKVIFKLDHADKKILSSDDYKKLRLMFESVMAHIPARRLIEADGVAERSYFWRDEETGADCKCRPDKYIDKEGLLVDVKTTPDLKKFHLSVEDYRYHVQDPWYCDGLGRFTDQELRMEFLVIQKNISIGRYPVMVVKLPPEVIEYGRVTYKNDLRRYAEFLSAGECLDTVELHMRQRFLDQALEDITEVHI